jgi:uncharacterized protein YqgC (DUF456 family)
LRIQILDFRFQNQFRISEFNFRFPISDSIWDFRLTRSTYLFRPALLLQSKTSHVMASFWWIITLLLMFVGLAGTVLPLIPGTTIILAGAILHRLMLGEAHSIGWWTLSALIVLTLLSYAIDLVSGALGAKWFGATRWGALGGIIGAIVGLFFGIPGIFIGPLLGVLIGELLGGKGLLPAGVSTWGTLLGTTAGIIGRVLVAIVMIGWFLAVTLPRV